MSIVRTNFKLFYVLRQRVLPYQQSHDVRQRCDRRFPLKNRLSLSLRQTVFGYDQDRARRGTKGCKLLPAVREWFAPAVAAPGISEGMATDLKCPVFKREDMDDPTGNLWPLERLSPCKLLSVPHASHASNLVVLSRFASFLDQVPEVQ